MNLRNRGCSYPHLYRLWAHVRVTSHYLAELNDYKIGAKKTVNVWHNTYSVQIPDVTDYVRRRKIK